MNFSLGWSQRRNTLAEAIERLESIDLLTLKEFRSLFPDADIRREVTLRRRPPVPCWSDLQS
jgi:hypothetical protein